MRKGITPIIAIVLLLMMTVAAGGGAYVWLTQMQEDFQQRAEEEAARSVSLNGLQCFNQGGTGWVQAYMKNGGSTQIDANPVDMNVRYAANDSVVFSLTKTGLSLAEGELGADVYNINGNYVGQPGSAAAYNISTGTFASGTNYEIEFVFTDEESTSISGTCQAE